MSLYERPRIVKFMETERELWLRGTMGRGTGVLFKTEFQQRKMKKVWRWRVVMVEQKSM